MLTSVLTKITNVYYCANSGEIAAAFVLLPFYKFALETAIWRESSASLVSRRDRHHVSTLKITGVRLDLFSKGLLLDVSKAWPKAWLSAMK